MVSRTHQVGVARSRLPGKADRNRHRYAVAVASGIWRPELAMRLIRRSPEKPHHEPSSPICIAYLAFQSRVFLMAYALPYALGESSASAAEAPHNAAGSRPTYP
jgi:hypothetical protein